MERVVQLTYILLFHLHAYAWFEFVDSKSNWADGISRELEHDPFALRHGYHISELSIPLHLWLHTYEELWKIIRELH